MRLVNRAGIALAGLTVTVTLAGCGSSGGTLLSTATASQLKSVLGQASTALSAYNCDVAYSDLNNFKTDISELSNVNSTLVMILNQSADTITTLAAKRCPTTASSTTATTATTQTQPTTTTTATSTTSTVVTTPPDTVTTEPETTPTVPSTPETTSVPEVTSTPQTTSTPDSGGSGFGGGGDGNSGAGNTGAGAGQ